MQRKRGEISISVRKEQEGRYQDIFLYLRCFLSRHGVEVEEGEAEPQAKKT